MRPARKEQAIALQIQRETIEGVPLPDAEPADAEGVRSNPHDAVDRRRSRQESGVANESRNSRVVVRDAPTVRVREVMNRPTETRFEQLAGTSNLGVGRAV
jgi:hypothetical protein